MPYFLLFAAVTLLGFLSDIFYRKHKKISIVFSVISIVIFSTFAAIRSYDVGTDINVYGLKRFEREIGSGSFLSNINNYQDIEYGYSFINHIVAKFTHDFRVFLFIHQAILASIMYIVAYKEKKKRNTKIYLTTLVYSFIWFNTSLNIIRQSIAIFILLLCYPLAEEKKNTKYAASALLTSTIHTSNICYLAIPLINKFYSNKNSALRLIVTCLLMLASFSMIDVIFNIIASFIPILQKYSMYVQNNHGAINMRYLIYKILFFSIILFFQRTTNAKKREHTSSLVAFAAIDVVSYSLSAFIRFGYRLSYLFLVHYIYLIPRIESDLKNRKDKRLFIIIVIMLLIGYWINRYVLCGYDGTIPYKIGV